MTIALLARVWRSPTAMTWASVVSRMLSLMVVLPLLLNRLGVEEIAVWYLLMTLVSLQNLADVGLAPTFARVIAYGMGGTSNVLDLSRGAGESGPNWRTIENVWSSMFIVYRRLTFATILPFAALSIIAMWRPLAALQKPTDGWFACGVIIVVFAVSLHGNAYSAYLQGVNEVALVRRWETAFALIAMGASVIVLLLGGGLLELVIANQMWMVVAVLRNRWLCLRVNNGRASGFKVMALEASVLKAVWGSAWRSGVGVVFSRGIVFSTGLVLGQFLDAPALAAYLVAFRVLQLLIDLANAPFYSRIPTLSRLWSEQQYDKMIGQAARGMSLSYWTYVIGVVGAGVLAPVTLHAVGSNADWASPELWIALTLAFMAERFGAMHGQLYSASNRVAWHVAHGIAGSIIIVVGILLLPTFSDLAFPLASLVAYVGFFSWYLPMKVYRTIPMNFWSFQRQTALVPCICLLVYASVELLSR